MIPETITHVLKSYDSGLHEVVRVTDKGEQVEFATKDEQSAITIFLAELEFQERSMSFNDCKA